MDLFILVVLFCIIVKLIRFVKNKLTKSDYNKKDEELEP